MLRAFPRARAVCSSAASSWGTHGETPAAGTFRCVAVRSERPPLTACTRTSPPTTLLPRHCSPCTHPSGNWVSAGLHEKDQRRFDTLADVIGVAES